MLYYRPMENQFFCVGQHFYNRGQYDILISLRQQRTERLHKSNNFIYQFNHVIYFFFFFLAMYLLELDD